jgi:hypothetical protein
VPIGARDPVTHTVHPAFDPETSTWFVSWPSTPGSEPDRSAEAKSLRELIKMLPPGWKIQGHYSGRSPFSSGRAARPPAVEPRSDAALVPAAATRPSLPIPYAPPKPARTLEPRVINNKGVADPRPNSPGPKPKKISERDKEILCLHLDKKMTFSEVAKNMKISPGAVAGVVYRSRQRT